MMKLYRRRQPMSNADFKKKQTRGNFCFALANGMR